MLVGHAAILHRWCQRELSDRGGGKPAGSRCLRFRQLRASRGAQEQVRPAEHVPAESEHSTERLIRARPSSCTQQLHSQFALDMFSSFRPFERGTNPLNPCGWAFRYAEVDK